MKFSSLLSYDSNYGIRGMQEKAQAQLEQLAAKKGFSYFGADHQVRELFAREIVVNVQVSITVRQSHAPAPESLRMTPISAILIIASYSLDHLQLLDELVASSAEQMTTSSLKQIYIADFARLRNESEVFRFYEQFGISRNMLPVLLRFRGLEPTEGFAGLKDVAKHSREIACTTLAHFLFKNLVEERHLHQAGPSRHGTVTLKSEELLHLNASAGLTPGSSFAAGLGEKSYTSQILIESDERDNASVGYRIGRLNRGPSKTSKGKKRWKKAVDKPSQRQ